MASLWEILGYLTAEERLWLLIWTLICIVPFIGFAIAIKRRIRVGKVDLHAFTMYLIIFAIMLYAGLDALSIDALNLYINFGGIFVGIILMVVIFNKVSEGVRKTFIFEMQLEDINVNLSYCYTYEHAGNLCIIKLDQEGHESFWSMLKRMKGKRTYLICEGARFEFTEHKVNLAYFCTSWKRTKIRLNIEGKEKICDAIHVMPIPTTKFSQLEFLVNFQSFDELTTEINAEKMKRMKLEAKIYLLASELFRQWVDLTEKAQFGTERPTLQQIIASLVQPKQDDRIQRTVPADAGEADEGAEEDEEEEEPPLKQGGHYV